MPRLLAPQQSPAAKPAPRPRAIGGRGPRNSANTHAAISASRNVRPKTNAMLALFICSGETPASRCQALPNNAGEYQTAPSANVATAAAITARMLTSGIVAPLVVSFWTGRELAAPDSAS